MANDFFSEYLQYVGETEVPTFFHRWSAIVGLGAFLERSYFLEHGHNTILPNIYAMLIGSPGTRKSSAIKLFKKVMREAGYGTFAADKTTKEKFLADLAGIATHESEAGAAQTVDSILDSNLWGEEEASASPVQCFIAADEFNDFFGNGNLEFISLLGSLWDYHGIYTSRIKNGKSISINNPTISLLGGNTPVGFSSAFPPETLGQGFFSRILLIYGEGTGKRIAFPSSPTADETSEITAALVSCRQKASGLATLAGGSKALLTKIYETYPGIDDIRFESYSNRRFTHLLKLCLVVSAANRRSKITEEDVVAANSLLTFTEYLMPKALGEFGKAKNSDVSHMIISYLKATPGTVTLKEIWAQVSSHLNRLDELVQILAGLQNAGKLLQLNGGFTICQKNPEMISSDILDFSTLSDEEMRLLNWSKDHDTGHAAKPLKVVG